MTLRRQTAAEVLETLAPALSFEEVSRAIFAAASSPWRELAALTALGTVYGVRRMELGELRPQYFALDIPRVSFPTQKRGRPRIHTLPAEILPVIDPQLFERPRSHYVMDGWWQELERRAEIPDRQWQNWHCLRRSLTQFLEESGVANEIADQWMGWRTESFSMGARYRRRPMGVLDDLVLPRHPLLAVWKEALGGRLFRA